MLKLDSLLAEGKCDGGQLVTLPPQQLKIFRRNNSALNKQFQPVTGFFGLSTRVAAFRDELRFVPTAMGFPVVRADGCSRPEQLLSEQLGFRRLR